MEIKEKQKILIEYANTLKGATSYFREDWDCEYFSLLGKCFGMMNEELITLKGYPEENDTLRETFEDIIPGYYANKVHWNSIYLKTEVITIEDLKKYVEVSYELVYKKLSKKEKLMIEDGKVTA